MNSNTDIRELVRQIEEARQWLYDAKESFGEVVYQSQKAIALLGDRLVDLEDALDRARAESRHADLNAAIVKIASPSDAELMEKAVNDCVEDAKR